MITFYPGPSKVYSKVPQYVREAYDAGMLSINHRSPEFMQLFQQVTKLLKNKLAVPDEYEIMFCSSATECWEIICQSLVKKTSLHVYNGAFGEKWLRYATNLVPFTEQVKFEPEGLPSVTQIKSNKADLIALTHNETSNGTALPKDLMQEVRDQFKNEIIAVDATSSMAGVVLPWEVADVWYASVQKCFGLPAGLAVLVLSPQAVARTKEIGEKRYYNSLLNIYTQTQKSQTTHTPNILGIYLMSRVLKDKEDISIINKRIEGRYTEWVNLLSNLSYVKLFIESELVRSKTVIPVEGEADLIQRLKSEAKQTGITLGNGYGELKSTTLRIANFPAITDIEINQLINFFTNFAPD